MPSAGKAAVYGTASSSGRALLRGLNLNEVSRPRRGCVWLPAGGRAAVTAHPVHRRADGLRTSVRNWREWING